jgi:hypothetical protein
LPKYYQEASIYPPLHPIPHEKAPLQQANKFSLEILVYNFYPDAIHILSEIASTVPKAQQDPQLD